MPSTPVVFDAFRAVARRFSGPFAVALLALSLAACEPGKPRPSADDKAIAAAAQLGASGQHAAAADAFLTLAAKEKRPYRQQFELDAVEQLLALPDLARAARVLGQIDMQGATDGMLSRHQLLGARLALAGDDPERALGVLGPTYPGAPAADRVLRAQLRVIARKRLGQSLEEVQERLALAPLLTNPAQIANNLDDLWATLARLDDATLQFLTGNASAPELAAWAELALIDRQSRFDYLQFQAQANDWRVRHPNHRAAGDFLDRLIANYAAPLQTPSQIALLLPLSGRYAGQAAAVRDGFLAAHYERQATAVTPVTVRVYDTGDGQIDVGVVYAQAVADGARIVVGPLAKPAVEAMAARADLDVPVLALNRIDTAGASANFYQFGLPPEDEADALAERALAEGNSRALVVATEGAWGERVIAAFRAGMEARGGQVLTVARLPATISDYRVPLQTALLLDQSLARAADVAARIGTRPEFEPRRREDVQVILVGANDRQMRVLRPQLEFHHAEDLPIRAVSNIYTGSPDATADRDLNGVVFADSPWRIDDATQAPSERLAVDRYWPERNAQVGNLFALGVDAYRLLPYVPRLANATGTTLDGASGGLYLDAARQVHRRPVFAMFRNGVPVRAPDPPLPATPVGLSATP